MNTNEKINKNEVEDILHLTPLQEGMLFHYLHEPESDQYFEQLSLRLVGVIKTDIFEKAWAIVIGQNEMLRTVFRWNKISHPVQIILKHKSISIDHKDLSQLDSTEKLTQLESIKKGDKAKKIDLSTEPFRIMLVKLADNENEMIISNHHIIYDGWSNGILLKEFMLNYFALYNNTQIQVSEKRKFKDFVKWIHGKNKEYQADYWKSYLSDFDMKSSLPVDYAKPKNEGRQISNLSYTFNTSLVEKMNKLRQTYELTFSTLVYTAWGLLLQKYNDSDDVIFGTAVSGRTPDITGIEEIVGLMINTLPLRVKSEANQKVYQLLKKINSDLRSRVEHEGTPLSDIISYSSLPKEAGLFDSIMVVENYPIDEDFIKNGELLRVQSFDIFEMTNFDLSLQVLFFNNRIELIIQYNMQTMNQQTIENLACHFFNILEEMANDPEKELTNISFLSEKEYQSLLSNFNNQFMDTNGLIMPPDSNTIQYHLLKSMSSNKNKIALEYVNTTVSYGELDTKSNMIANKLLSNGLEKGTFVGILTDDKIELITSIIGILKAGGVFVPLDTKYPIERLKTMISTTDTRYVLVDTEYEHVLVDDKTTNNTTIAKINIDELFTQRSASELQRPEITYHEDDALYVFFTSGSSGTPKAVIGRNGSLMHFIHWEIKNFSLDDTVRVSQFTSPCHNPLLRDIFVPLCAGGTICIPESKEKMLDSNYLIRWVEESNVNLIHCTPSLFKLLSSTLINSTMFPALKYILLAGERATPKDLAAWYEVIGERIQLVSLYGQTETTLAKMCYLIQPSDVKKVNIPIGKPINGAQVAILDKDMNFCAIGFKGEIYIRTPYRSLGYYNNTELNQRNFLVNPFSNDPHDIIYKTGDVGKILPDGNIEFLGRADRQIKIRGFRIELNEVENTLLLHRLVKEAAVVVKENTQSNNYLCAYIVFNTDLKSITQNNDINEIRTFISQKLPDYMIPQYFIPLDHLPMNLNGKLDYKALPEPEQQEYIAPVGEIEIKLAALWCEILGIERVSRSDKFLESGGHSLNIMSLIFKVQQQFSIELPLTEVFKNITIKELADFITNSQPVVSYDEIKPLQERDYYTLSPTQNGMFVSNQLHRNHTFYNIPYVAEIDGEVNIKRLEEAFKSLILRHESLRTSFHYVNGRPVQKIESKVEFHIEVVETVNIDVDKSIKEFVRPFDLTVAPLFRIKLILTHDKHYLLFDMHHIISDGVSMTIIVKDLISLYGGNKLPDLKVQYKDYVEWLHHVTGSNLEQEQYWLEVFRSPVPKLMLQTDYPRPSNVTYDGRVVKFVLNNELKDRLSNLAGQLGCTSFMIFLTAYILLLHKYTKQEDIVVGVPIAGRTNPETENIVGTFINLLALRNHFSPEDSILDLLLRVKDHSLQAFMYQNFPFEQLVNKLAMPSDLSRHPIFDTMFVMQNMEPLVMEFEEITFKTYEIERNTTKYDLSLLILEQNHNWILEFEYSTKLFKDKTIQRLGEHYLEILEQMEAPQAKISDIKLLEHEPLQVTNQFKTDTFAF
ncbi:non-ribosomal peptide synthetase [Paenibacillus tyrfis]|uniref:Carrier domain-containing protein n=1 Tax=Paenibacillus tyrfis TaxID=1501230 RepID=A0A081NTN6_9BACL|nr:non-ribosomal peptide synthetase [Paenibacillus tyrfis]KEQ21809.1 hypothetical protein ET33_30840 [Paenibacillus tyrfis]